LNVQTTKRTIEANERLMNELDFHAVQSTELAHQNDRLLAENRRLKTELVLLKCAPRPGVCAGRLS
jgi:hypothetical protein